jgi:hypothetical protein
MFRATLPGLVPTAPVVITIHLVRLASGDARRAVTLLEQAVSIADTTGDIEPTVTARSGLARAHLQLGDPAATGCPLSRILPGLQVQ